MRRETVLAAEADPGARAAFVRGALGRLARAGLAFAVLLGVLLCVLPVAVVNAWMRQAPLAVALAAASLGAAWAARWWAETERGRPLFVLGLHAAIQSVVLAPLACVAFAWFGAWILLPIALMLTSVLAATPRVMRFHLLTQTAQAALALSAAAADPVWCVCGLVRCALTARD
jgi:hypothetical protein